MVNNWRSLLSGGVSVYFFIFVNAGGMYVLIAVEETKMRGGDGGTESLYLDGHGP